MVDGNYFVKDVKILSREYFSNNNTENKKPVFAIHYFSGSWKTKTQLTLLQYLVFSVKFLFLRGAALFLGNKIYISINDALWRGALRKTHDNLNKERKIYKVL